MKSIRISNSLYLKILIVLISYLSSIVKFLPVFWSLADSMRNRVELEMGQENECGKMFSHGIYESTNKQLCKKAIQQGF